MAEIVLGMWPNSPMIYLAWIIKLNVAIFVQILHMGESVSSQVFKEMLIDGNRKAPRQW